MQLAPTKQRIGTLDLLRGLSLFGILLVNLLAFNFPVNYVSLREFLEHPTDLQMEKYLTIFVQGSFYPLFAGLFGYGLQMQMNKSKELGESFIGYGSKRLSFLLLIGLLHAFFIWYGDILTTYAVLGFGLLFLLKLRPIFQLLIATILFGICSLIVTVLFYISSQFISDSSEYTDVAGVAQSIEAYRYGGVIEIFFQRLNDLSLQYSIMMWISAFFTILPFMLVGAAASQWRLIERAGELKKLWFVLCIIGLSLGLYLKNLIYHEPTSIFYEGIGQVIGAPILTVGYVALIVLLGLIPWVQIITKPIQAAGRMSLTIYLMQSVIQSILFYGFGFGLYGKLSLLQLFYIALAIYAIQLVFSMIWFKYFKQGPVEALWKSVTYGKRFEK